MSVDSIIATINRNLASKWQAKEEAVEPKPERVRKKPGPNGSKNRKRLAAEAAAAAAAGEAGTSQGRGQPRRGETGGIVSGRFIHARATFPSRHPRQGEIPCQTATTTRICEIDREDSDACPTLRTSCTRRRHSCTTERFSADKL